MRCGGGPGSVLRRGVLFCFDLCVVCSPWQVTRAPWQLAILQTFTPDRQHFNPCQRVLPSCE